LKLEGKFNERKVGLDSIRMLLRTLYKTLKFYRNDYYYYY